MKLFCVTHAKQHGHVTVTVTRAKQHGQLVASRMHAISKFIKDLLVAGCTTNKSFMNWKRVSIAKQQVASRMHGARIALILLATI